MVFKNKIPKTIINKIKPINTSTINILRTNNMTGANMSDATPAKNPMTKLLVLKKPNKNPNRNTMNANSNKPIIPK